MITLMYSCKACGLVKEKAFVRYRHEDEDILDWMKEVQLAVAMHHDLASPGLVVNGVKGEGFTVLQCKPKEISEVYIPMADKEGGRGIGLRP